MIFLVDLHSALGDYCYSQVVLNSILSHLLDKHAPSKNISKLLHASSSISPSDPVPLSIFKLYSNYLCPTICNIISYSLNSSTVPSIFKQAIITPILKKPSLDPESLLNYHSISQVPLVSTILERVVSRQLISYLPPIISIFLNKVVFAEDTPQKQHY